MRGCRLQQVFPFPLDNGGGNNNMSGAASILPTGFAEIIMTSFSSSASQGDNVWGDTGGGRRYGCGRGLAWRPLEIAAMVAGFIVYWPIGLAVIGLKIWQRRSGHPGDLFSFAKMRAEELRHTCRTWKAGSWTSRDGNAAQGNAWSYGMRPTGNSAFDEWRAGELARLEAERRKLEDAEREFAAHIEELRKARDREEFERFMAARRGPAA